MDGQTGKHIYTDRQIEGQINRYIVQLDNGFRIYIDIMTGKKWRQFSLLTGNSFVGQFVHPVGRDGMGDNRVEGRNRQFSPLQV